MWKWFHYVIHQDYMCTRMSLTCFSINHNVKFQHIVPLVAIFYVVNNIHSWTTPMIFMLWYLARNMGTFNTLWLHILLLFSKLVNHALSTSILHTCWSVFAHWKHLHLTHEPQCEEFLHTFTIKICTHKKN
jgi:hypothetical protein